ncbi:MAG: Nramp family divalent metal transporter, partial [Candidatus Omnitrophica bacterium]|nr:Nramp family divalent metal transporter [Candidatus Omnitrophota bacterium]
ALVLWVLLALSFLWFGSFASGGGTALAPLTHFPVGWDERSQRLFWAYSSIAVFFVALVFSRVVYTVVERFMEVVAVVTLVGLVIACSHPAVLAQLPSFTRGLIVPQWPPPRPWDPADATKLLTAITFAGLGGFWTLFYSYWLREKGAGMASRMGHVEGLRGRHEVEFEAGAVPSDASAALPMWRRFLMVDSAVGIIGNIVTTLMTCLLAYAVLHPQGLLPDKYELAVVQSRFFELSWGAPGRMLFLIVAAAFLSDTWMATADAVARIHTDCLLSFFPSARRWSVKRWYLICLVIGTVVTCVTMLFSEPGPLILLSALIGFLGTVSFAVFLYLLNHRLLPRHLDRRLCPQRWAAIGLGVSGTAYAALALAYLFRDQIATR